LSFDETLGFLIRLMSSNLRTQALVALTRRKWCPVANIKQMDRLVLHGSFVLLNGPRFLAAYDNWRAVTCVWINVAISRRTALIVFFGYALDVWRTSVAFPPNPALDILVDFVAFDLCAGDSALAAWVGRELARIRSRRRTLRIDCRHGLSTRISIEAHAIDISFRITPHPSPKI
jgi:hypothetical protein